MDHGNEPAEYPSIEVERMFSRIEGVTRYLVNNPNSLTRDELLQQILDAASCGRSSFRDHLMNVSDERMRLIEQVSCASSENTL
jgi:hypothetical protein